MPSKFSYPAVGESCTEENDEGRSSRCKHDCNTCQCKCENGKWQRIRGPCTLMECNYRRKVVDFNNLKVGDPCNFFTFDTVDCKDGCKDCQCVCRNGLLEPKTCSSSNCTNGIIESLVNIGDKCHLDLKSSRKLQNKVQ